MISGVNENVIDEIISHLSYISSFEFVKENILCVNEHLVKEVIKIINEVFDETLEVPVKDLVEVTFGKYLEQNLNMLDVCFSDFSCGEESSDDDL